MKNLYRPPFLRFALFLGLLCAAILTFFIAQKFLHQSESQIAFLQKTMQNATLADLCHKNSLESAIQALQKETPSFALQIEGREALEKVDVWHSAWQAEIPPNQHWAAWLKNAAQRLPADVQFSACTWQAEVRLVQCRAALYRVDCAR